MREKRSPINYAIPGQTSRKKDLLLLAVIGGTFAIAFGSFLFWWVLYRGS